jgi:hypothetical protein
MKYLPLVGAIVFMVLMSFPISDNVTIIKSDIESNRVFAGVINDDVVGTNLCCKYWLEKDTQPDTAEYHIIKPLGLSVFGYIYSVESH